MTDKPKLATVLNGGTPAARLQYTSVSALQKLRGCPRKYALRYVSKLPDPPGKGAERGTAGHARIKHYGLTGENVLDPLEQLGIDKGYIPRDPMSPRFEWEREFSGDVKLRDVPLVGAIDLVEVSSKDATSATITDWKFKKDISRYGAEKEDLIDPSTDEGLQMLGYVAAVSVRYPALIEVAVAHVTFQTEGRREVVRTAEFVRVAEGREKFTKEAEKLVTQAQQVITVDPLTVDPGPNPPCDKYGGCKYRSTCWSPQQKIQQLFKRDDLFKRNTPEKEGNMGFIGKVSLPSSAPVVSATPAPVAPTASVTIPPLPANALPDVLPPDAPRSNPALASKPVTPAAPKPVVPQNEAQTVAALQASITPTVVTSPPAEAEKPKRGRPRKMNIVDAAPAPAVVEPVAKVEAKAEVITHTPPAAAEEPAEAGLFLYFGCSPVGVPTSTLHAYVNEIDKEVRASAQLKSVDLRADGSNEYGFGKWRGYLAAIALQHLPEPGHYVITSGDERVSVVAEALISKASLVVIGSGR